MLKRGFDFFSAIIILVCVFPLVVVVGVLIRKYLGSPIFFTQERPGLGGLPFRMIKFRTMLRGTDSAGRLLPDSQRLTRLGKMLRSTSLDELPELWNVVKGDMSLVGPRPLLMEYIPLYSTKQFRRHEVRPGVTGWAQVNGRNSLNWEEKFDLDVWYVDNHSFWLDLKILFLTIRSVFVRTGINKDGEATMSKFTGSTD